MTVTANTTYENRSVFLDLNGIEIDAPKGSLYDLTLSVATGKAGKAEIAEFFRTKACCP